MGWFGKRKKKGGSTPGSSGGQPPKVVKISQYLSEKTICFFDPAAGKKGVLEKLVGSMGLPDPAEVLKAITDREAAGPTVIAPGISAPHARLQGVTALRAAIGIIPAGMAEPGAEGGPIRLFFLFISPAGDLREHLGFLAGIASLFQVEGFADALIKETTPAGVLSRIRAAEKSLS